MPRTIDPELRRAIAARLRFYNDMGIYDFYRQPPTTAMPIEAAASGHSERTLVTGEEMSPRKSAALVIPVAGVAVADIAAEESFRLPEQGVSDPIKALQVIRQDLGDCTRCPLHQQGRKQIVFGVGNPTAELMFIGEGPGADEDEKGEPFVGRAGQLLNNMIKAMGIERAQVYIANIVKCRPPGNRQPEREECATCSPFLMRQIVVVKPKVIVALGATAAKTLLAMNSSMLQLRGRFYDFRPSGVANDNSGWDGCKLAVTYHPAFLLRDPRQKGEAWKDLQMVMKELGMKAPKAATT
jgi:uracil-DNA glycosylase